MPTLLRYDLTTNPFPLQASAPSSSLNQATLTVVASNPNTDPDQNRVALQGISISIPVGADGTDLVGAVTDITPIPPAGWNPPTPQSQNGVVQYTFLPKQDTVRVGGAGLSFVFNLGINSQPGTVAIEVMEGSGGCVSPDCPTQSFYVTKFPDTWGEVLFWADPTVVEVGAGPTLHWAGPPLTKYVITYYTPQDDMIHQVPAKQGDPPLANHGQYPEPTQPGLQLTRDTTFYLTAERTVNHQTFSAQRQVIATVQMPPPRIISFQETPMGFGGPDTQVTLSWQTANVAELRIKDVGTFTGAEAAQGSVQVTRSALSLFQAEGYGGTAYLGPPAIAHICFGKMVSIPIATHPDDPQKTLTLLIGDNRPVLDINITSATHAGIMSGNTSSRIWLGLPPGVSAADLGTSRASVSVQDLENATYSTSLPQTDAYSFSLVDLFPTETYPLPTGTTWGLQLPDNTKVLVWFDSVNMSFESGLGSINFTWFEF